MIIRFCLNSAGGWIIRPPFSDQSNTPAARAAIRGARDHPTIDGEVVEPGEDEAEEAEERVGGIVIYGCPLYCKRF